MPCSFSIIKLQDVLCIYIIEATRWAGAPGIEAASQRKHAGRAELADTATELVDLPPSLSPGRVFTILIVPYRLLYR